MPRVKSIGLLLWVLLASCASSETSRWEEGREGASSWREVCEDPPSLVFLCGQQACAFYHCADLEFEPAIQLARGAPLLRPSLPAPGGSAQRHWGSAQGLTGKAQPVFIIPWYNEKPQRTLPLFTQEQLQEIERAKGKPVERHHIFPQEFKAWFKRHGINVHAWTLVILKEDHDRIHRGANGGPWNGAWREFTQSNEGATKEAIWRYAGELIYQFELYGPVVPYYRRKPKNSSASATTP